VSREGCDAQGLVEVPDRASAKLMNLIYHSEFFIGLGSGSSWLAWALNKQVVMICNFSEEDHEFTSDCIRIVDKSICHGCWNKEMFKFDKGNWYWCPEHEHTDRQFECHKLITADRVIEEIKKAYLV
jgi:autotransporter strand-loop-strand O-heptosyltransferase